MDGRGYNSVKLHIVHQANLDIVTTESGIRTGINRILLLCTCTLILIEVHSGVCLLKDRVFMPGGLVSSFKINR